MFIANATKKQTKKKPSDEPKPETERKPKELNKVNTLCIALDVSPKQTFKGYRIELRSELFKFPPCIKTEEHVLNILTVPDNMLPSVLHVGMDVKQCVH